MMRRELLLLLGGVMTAAPGLRAQEAMPVIGYLNSQKPAPTLDEFRNGLAEQGFYEGRNVVIEYRWAQRQYDRLPAMVAELVRHPVDVIVATGGGVSGRAAKAATATIPIVVLTGADPINSGLPTVSATPAATSRASPNW